MVDACVLCGTPYLAPNVHGCFCPGDRYAEYAAALAEHESKAKYRADYERSLASKPRYFDYLHTALRDEIIEANPEMFAATKLLTPSSFLFLWGVGARGKTHTAVRSTGRISKLFGVSALYINEVDYFKALSAEMNGGPKAPDLLAPQVLLYDDLGKKSPTPYALERLYDMLENRWVGKKATIITSNRSPEALAGSLSRDDGEAGSILSRLGSGHAFEVVGQRDGREGTAL